MKQYRISDEAIQDLESIADYFWTKNQKAGEQFLIAFNDRCKQLTNFPKLGRSYDQIRPGIRGLTLRGFIILYRVTESEEILMLEIVRVVSGRRDLNQLFSDS